MTKIVPVVLTPYQLKIFNSTARVSLVTGASGIGNTYGLLMKAFKEASTGKLVTFFKSHSVAISGAGGVFEQAETLADTFGARVSRKSQIITIGDGKIKFLGAERPLENSTGVSDDLVIMEHNIPENIIHHHLMRSKQIIIREAFHEIENSTPEHWLQKFGLVEVDGNGKPCKIADWAEHITASWQEGFTFRGFDDYHNIILGSDNSDLKKLHHYSF